MRSAGIRRPLLMHSVSQRDSSARHTRSVLRHSLERLWSPFNRNIKGPNLADYGFRETLASVCAPREAFTAQLNGTVGGGRIIEDLFVVLLCGFDIVKVSIENKRGHSLTDATDPCSFSGQYTLHHSRPFLGWVPPSMQLSADSTSHAIDNSNTINDNNNNNGQANMIMTSPPCGGCTPGECLYTVPFAAHLEGCDGLTHLALRTSVYRTIAESESCPPLVAECLGNKEALRMLVTLRRANVRPELLTAKTLLSVNKQPAAWASALGMMY